MRRMKRAATVMAAVSALVLAASTQASASQGSGWVSTANKGEMACFTADVKGKPGQERLSVCDLKVNDRPVVVLAYETGSNDGSGLGGTDHWLTDKTKNGKCVQATHNWYRTAVGATGNSDRAAGRARHLRATAPVSAGQRGRTGWGPRGRAELLARRGTEPADGCGPTALSPRSPDLPSADARDRAARR